MANVNDFLNKLGINSTIPQYQNSPRDPLAPDDAPINNRNELEDISKLQQEDPESLMPATEQDPEESMDLTPSVKSTTPLINAKDVDAMSKMSRSPAEEAMPVADPMVDAINAQQKGPNYYEDILNAYKSLPKAQEDYRSQNRNLDMLSGANKIAQGISQGYGNGIGDGSELVDGLKKSAGIPLDQIKEKMATAKTSMELGDQAEMVDPSSDVSKLYREQAYALLKKLRPDGNYDGKLEGMSASQLMKLPGMKNILGGEQLRPQSPWIATDRVDSHGNPIRFNKQTGAYSLSDGSEIKPGDNTYRDIMRKDQLTGNYALGNANGMNVLPTNYGNHSAKPEQQTEKDIAENKAPEYTYAQIAKAAPKQIEIFDKAKDKFNSDMKDSRDTATSVTNLVSKLASGDASGIDSGMLGSIQTQAAKMAGQKGVLTDQDLKKFAGAGGWEAMANRAVNNALNGRISKDDEAFFTLFKNKMSKSLEHDINNRSQLFVDQGRQQLDTLAPGITNENVSKLLGVSKVAPIAQETQDSSGLPPVQSGMIRFKDSQGKTHDIPEKNLEAAKKRDPGLKVIQ